MDISCVLIPVLAGLIFGILGYNLGKKTSSKSEHFLASSLQSDLDACKTHTKSLMARISSLEADLAEKKAKPSQKKSITLQTIPTLLFDTAQAKNILGKKVKENDLKIVEGIGPKIEALFNASGITTWHDLSQASTEKLQAILDAGGENYAIHNPSTWAKQALMAYEGKWQELKDWQAGLRGGKE
jgi:predicted flap endonuclease-1-like 5' DNA nuclease